MMKVALIGSHTEDTIYIVDELKQGGSHNIIKSYKRYGGISNLIDFIMWKGKGNIQPWGFWSGTSSVTVIVDKNHSERTMFIEKDYAREDKLEYWDRIRGFDWCHIAYLDTLDYLTIDHLGKLRDRNKIVSVDFCLTEYTPSEARRAYELLKLADVIFVSGDSFNALYRSGLDLTKYDMKDHIGITHHDGAVAYVDEYGHHTYKYDILPNLNTLGAGDYFAASFIYQSLDGFKAPEQMIEDAHIDTLFFLKEKNND
jgi:sugar/nucleoside kinase (ribokinase family)